MVTSTHDQGRDAAKLTRAYAQNRSLGVVVGLLVFSALFAAISILSYVGGKAYRDGNSVLFWTCTVGLVPVMTAVVYMAIPAWGGQRLEALTRRLYPEGNVHISVPDGNDRQRIALAMGITFGCCVVATVLLGLFGYVSPRHAQPVSALFVVPCLVILNVLMRPAVSYVALLWPCLYGLHAILIVAGAPIQFVEPWESLNIMLPMVGYGIVAACVGHVFNRLALHRLRQAMRTD